MNSEGVTSFAGVPFTYEAIDKLRILKRDMPTLKTMTQAGGKLSPELHKKLATWAMECGKRFVVMYGASEATARMGYLPPERSLEKQGSMGIPIPGGRFELIGADGMKADLEIIVTAIDALRACGASRFHVELGHAKFFRDLADRMELDSETVEQMRAYIEGKNFAALNDLLAPYEGNSACAALKRLSRLFGGAEVLSEAEKLAGKTDTVDYLRSLYDELSAAGYGQYVRFDLGMVHQIDYYTGVVFRGYVEGAGEAVLSGGRYDHLVEVFGREAQATGFCVDVDAVAHTLPETALPVLRTIVHYEPGYLAQALEAVDGRPAGTCELSSCTTLEESKELAAAKGADSVLVFDKDGERVVSL